MLIVLINFRLLRSLYCVCNCCYVKFKSFVRVLVEGLPLSSLTVDGGQMIYIGLAHCSPCTSSVTVSWDLAPLLSHALPLSPRVKIWQQCHRELKFGNTALHALSVPPWVDIRQHRSPHALPVSSWVKIRQHLPLWSYIVSLCVDIWQYCPPCTPIVSLCVDIWQHCASLTSIVSLCVDVWYHCSPWTHSATGCGDLAIIVSMGIGSWGLAHCSPLTLYDTVSCYLELPPVVHCICTLL